MKKILVLAALIVIQICGCTDKEASINTVMGEYIGRYAGCEEVFLLNQNGTFSQKLTRGSLIIYVNNGAWKADGKEIIFTDFVKALEFSPEGVKISPKSFTHFHADWTDNPPQLIFNIDFNYIAVRKK